jgi:hypothetical protein
MGRHVFPANQLILVGIDRVDIIGFVLILPHREADKAHEKP